MSSPAAQARHNQQVEELCGATIRALSGDPEVYLRAGRLHRGTIRFPAHASHLRPSTDDDFATFRGAADGLALRVRHSDPRLHRELAPEDEAAFLVFEMLEQFRVESLASAQTPGVVRNLRHRHETWSRDFHASGLTETAQGILLYTVAQICRSRVTREPVVQDTEDLLEATRFSIVPVIGKDLAALRRLRRNQSAYAVPALSIAEMVSALMSGIDRSAKDDGAARSRRGAFSLFVDTSDECDEVPVAPSGNSRILADAEQRYRVFTSAYDREVEVSTLVRARLLKEHRQRLDDRVADQGLNVPGLARELKALLAEPNRNGWDGGQEAGLVDGRSLTQLVTSPTERRLFRTARVEPVADCLVTLLVDCSGSMKQHNESVAVIVDVLSRALDIAGVGNEVLGFTTGAWNGGRAVRDWRRAGRPRHPGRLNELHHLVFKSADVPWRRARHAIAGLLKEDLYREGVDGEAVSWACDRMQQRTERRRMLVVISDGSPMDAATSLANDPHYLDHHLRQVVAREEARGSARIYGLGVGLDLSPYYPRSQALDLEQGVDRQVFREIITMLAGRRRR